MWIRLLGMKSNILSKQPTFFFFVQTKSTCSYDLTFITKYNTGSRTSVCASYLFKKKKLANCVCKHSLAVIGFQFFLPFALKNICHAKNKSGCWMPCCICIFRFLVCKSVFSLLLPSLCSCLVSDSCFRNLAEDRSGVNLKDLVHDPSLWVSPTLNHWTADPALHQAAGHWVLGHRENIKKKPPQSSKVNTF